MNARTSARRADTSGLSRTSVMGESLHVLEPGSQVQNAIYLAGGSDWPISPEEWETRAREALEQGLFDYVAGGAGSEATVRANREAFERRRLRPRMLTGNADRDLSVEVLGMRSPAWFQLYWWADRDLAGSLVDRAAAAGYGALVVTLDTLTLGWRERDLRNGYLPFLQGEGLAQFFADPLFRARLDAPPEEDPQTAALMALAAFPNLGLTWSDLAWLRERTTLPILVKGILTAEDARLALEHGVDGIVVSNHGGRQIDGAVAALDALVEGREAGGPDAAVLMDGGIRRGADVLKALALGADGVLLGRLYAYGLAVGGAAGVEAVIRQLAAEVDLTLALAGGRSVRELEPSMVAAATKD